MVMTALTATYCAFCAKLERAFDNFIDFFERIGRARAAAELTRQGYYEEAKRLMLEDN
jgi:hypothetical protein